MLLEVAGATQQKLCYSLSSSPPRADRYPTSPVHVPVSDLWTGSNAADDVGPGRLHQDVVPEHVGHSKLAQGPMGLDSLSDQVLIMDIDGPAAVEVQDEDSARTSFLGSMFTEVPPPALGAQPRSTPAPPAPTPQPPKRQSIRLLARPSSVSVSRRATHRLMRQLDIIGQGQAIGDEAVAQYERTYAGPMPRKTVVALAAVTRVASGVVMAASAALAADAEAAQVEVI
nr:unnamed protein product [Digitaria exilis]